MYESTLGEREAMGLKGRAYFEDNLERERLLDQLDGWMRELAGDGA